MTPLSTRYFEYLASPAWAAKRAHRIAHAKGRCEHVEGHERCEAKAVTVHHKTYERFGNERMSDLTALCNHHHSEADAARRARMLKRAQPKPVYFLRRWWRAVFGH